MAPIEPVIIETWAEAMSPSIIGIRNGLTRLGPRSFSTANCWDSVEMPPMPLPITTATR